MASCRHASPVPGLSILITLAPRSANRNPAEGPERYWLNSKTVNPFKGNSITLLLLIGFPQESAGWQTKYFLYKFCSFHLMLLQDRCLLSNTFATAHLHDPGNTGNHYILDAHNHYPLQVKCFERNHSSND